MRAAWDRTGSAGTSCFALGLALLLALQFALSGFALAAAGPMLDRWGNPICAAGTSHVEQAPGEKGDHGRLSACCQLGCPMAGAGGLAPAASAGIDWPRLETGWAGRPRDAHLVIAPDPWRPGNPRAPPRTA